MDETTAVYPQFFRKGARCLKRTGDTTAIEILIPEPGKALPLTHAPNVYPSKEILDQETLGLEQTDQDTYEGYVVEFAKVALRNREYVTELRRIRFDRQAHFAKQSK